MAHESVHILNPVHISNVSTLEEGVATYFADLYMREICNDLELRQQYINSGYKPSGEDQKYLDALNAVRPTFEIDKDWVKELRNLDHTLSNATTDIIHSLLKGLELNQIKFLVRKFNRTSDC